MKKNHSRDSFASRWGFILACIGSAVGMGNIWMFPTRVSKFGGGSFLLAYFLFVFVIGFSGVIGEMAFGRATRSGPIGAFSQAVASRGKNPKIGAAIGFIPVLGSLALAIGYSVVMGWILRYLVASLTGEVLAPTDIDGFSAMFGSTASPFGNNLYVILSLVIAFIIMAFGIASGIEKANKIMMPLFFLLFLGLAVYMFFQPGAAEGYRYMFRIDPEAIRQKETWVYALGQAFFSLSLAGMTSLINLYEAPTATIQEKFGLSRPRAVLVIAAIGTVISVCIQGIVEGWMNFVSIYVCPLGAGLAGIMFYWVYGEKFVREQVQKGRMKPIGRWLEPMTKFVFCGLTIAVFILGVLTPGGIG